MSQDTGANNENPNCKTSTHVLVIPAQVGVFKTGVCTPHAWMVGHLLNVHMNNSKLQRIWRALPPLHGCASHEDVRTPEDILKACTGTRCIS